jgi:hypothetical protein
MNGQYQLQYMYQKYRTELLHESSGTEIDECEMGRYLVGMVEMRTKQDFEKSRRRREDNIKIQIGCYGVH